MEWKEAVCRVSLWELRNRGHLTDCTPPRTGAKAGWGAGSLQTADVHCAGAFPGCSPAPPCPSCAWGLGLSHISSEAEDTAGGWVRVAQGSWTCVTLPGSCSAESPLGPQEGETDPCARTRRQAWPSWPTGITKPGRSQKFYTLCSRVQEREIKY